MHEIILEGSPYKRGLEHGKTFNSEIKDTYSAICKPIREKWGEEKERILQKLLKNIEESFPDLVEEMKGISKGSKMEFEDISLLNLYHGLGAIKFRCTNLAFANKKQGVIHGKTSDGDIRNSFYLLETVYPNKGVPFISVGYVGTVWTEAGVNNIGFSCGQSSSSTITGQDGRGISCLVMPRPLLQYCSSVEEGINFLSKYTMAGKGLNILISDSKGDAAVVEKSYKKQMIRRMKNGSIWNTNHFLNRDLAKYNFTRGKSLENSKERYLYLQKILKNRKVPHTIEEMKKILRSHKKPGAICRHSESYNGIQKIDTIWSAIFIPKERSALITHGHPCENKFREYNL